MKIRNILILISFGLLIWLLFDNIFQLDIAASKNDYLTYSEKLKVDRIQNIDSLKIFAKSKLNIIRQNAEQNSSTATKRIWIIFGLIFCQIILVFTRRKNN
jgi:hypothetical protein